MATEQFGEEEELRDALAAGGEGHAEALTPAESDTAGATLVVSRPPDEASVVQQVLDQAGIETLRLDDEPTVIPCDQLGRYPVLGRLGRGGMGEVLEVHDRHLGRKLAAKVLLRSAAEPALFAKFVQEAQVIGQLEHPNIVPIYDLAAAADGRLFYTMKRVRGRTLEQLLQEPSYSLPRLLQIFLKICDGVALAHSRGVVHRDLKPANVMVGEFGEVLVMDWGLALVRSRQAEEAQTGVVLGTPHYMPPEQATGRIGEIDRRADVYSLGVMLYLLLCGRLPFRGKTPRQVIERVIAGGPPPPSRLAPARQIPWELETAALKAMAHAREERYQSVEELKADLEAYLDGRVLAAARYSPAQRLTKWAVRHRVRLGAAAGLVALLAALGLAGLRLQRERQRRREFAELGRAAGRAFQQARWEEAANAARRALDRYPTPKLQRLLAGATRELDRLQARRELRERVSGLAERIDRARPYFYIAEIDLVPRLQPIEQATSELESLVRDPRYAAFPDAWRLLGEARWLLSRHGPAEQALLAAIERGLDPRSVAARLGTIALHRAWQATLGHGDRAKTERLLDQARRWFAQVQEDQELQGRVIAAYNLLAQRRFDDALRLAEQAVERHRRSLGSEALFLVIAHCRLQHTRSPDNERAIEAASQALARLPHQAPAHEVRAHALYHQRRYVEALRDLERAIAIAPAAYTQMLRGIALGSLRRFGEALQAFDAALAADPRLVNILVERAHVLQDMGRLDAALRNLDTAVRLDPRHPAGWVNRGVLRSAMGNDDGALADYARAIEVEPRSHRPYHNRADIHLRRGDVAGALRDWTLALERAPDFVPSLHARAVALQRSGRTAEAIADYSRAIRVAPDDPRLRNDRGLAYLDARQHARAIADFDRAIALAPRHYNAYNSRGTTYRELGRHADALADFQQAIRIDPGQWMAHANKAVSLAALGRAAEARAAMQQAVERAPEALRDKLRQRMAGFRK